MDNKNIFIVGNGCDRRLLDSQRIKKFFQNDGGKVANSPSNADFIFVNTCAMSQTAEDTSVKLIQKYLKYKGRIIVHGCLPDIAPRRFKNEFSSQKIISIGSKNLDEEMDKLFIDTVIKFSDTPTPIDLAADQSFISKVINKFKADEIFFLTCLSALKFKIKNPNKKLHPRIKKGAYLQISKGCTDVCSYCAIPRAIGSIKSKEVDDILREYARILEKGEKTFIFTADNLGLYGVDFNSSLVVLLEEMKKIDTYYHQVNWIFNELHPKWLIKLQNKLIEYVDDGRIKELCIPIQSGNDRVLDLMKRNYKIADVTSAIKNIKQKNPTLRITTDVIIGFPTETDDEFLDTIKSIVNIRFDQVMFFSYGERENTKAAELNHDEKKNKKEIARRFKLAMKLLDREKISYTFQ